MYHPFTSHIANPLKYQNLLILYSVKTHKTIILKIPTVKISELLSCYLYATVMRKLAIFVSF